MDKAMDFMYWKGMAIILLLFIVAGIFKLTVMIWETDEIKEFPKVVISLLLFIILVLISMVIFGGT